jgi:hypothetical protein
MSEMQTDRDERTGRFQLGHKGGGRPKGSRNKLAESFVADLRDCWELHGVQALERCALEEPSQFLRVIASLMPKDVNLSVEISAVAFADRFRAAAELLGHDVDPPRLRRPLPGQRVIEHGE